MLFEAFWQVTGEKHFDSLIESHGECYRLTIQSSRGENHRVFRLQRSSLESVAGSVLVAHYFQGGDAERASAWTHQISLEDRHWLGLHAALTVAGFWQLPAAINRGGLDGATYTFEAHRGSRRHQIERWSPGPVASGGELFCVATDYMERLGELAAYKCELYRRYG